MSGGRLAIASNTRFIACLMLAPCVFPTCLSPLNLDRQQYAEAIDKSYSHHASAVDRSGGMKSYIDVSNESGSVDPGACACGSYAVSLGAEAVEAIAPWLPNHVG